MSNRDTRSLVRLAASASAARTLNLVAAHKRHADSEAYRTNPLFQSSALNRSIIVKHRLRNHERETFGVGRQSATKVLIPFETTDLRLGARSFFVGQFGYDDFFDQLDITGDTMEHDKRVLAILDKLPSLDPFLTREKLKAHGFFPARCYFDLTTADTRAMFSVVRTELKPLIGLSFADVDVPLGEKTAKLAEKILANAADAELEPLRVGLGMSKPDFSESVFCWKGFIYYKWRLLDLLPRVRPVATEIANIKPTDTMDTEARIYISAAREKLNLAIAQACKTVGETLRIYETAYDDLTINGRPGAFREFLLTAPSLFYQLGERLGAVDHIVSFWRYRFPPRLLPRVTVEELIDLFVDFENSLAFTAQEPLMAA